ncbi:hypothetical protein [Pseudogemmobacter faecipullorum]|nr:hypothetical protein [Pseudogemmobacter faecipullorum]
MAVGAHAPGAVPPLGEIRRTYDSFWHNFAAAHRFTGFLRQIFG